MLDLKKNISDYLEYCQFQKELSKKTLKAYGIDLKQFYDAIQVEGGDITRANLIRYITVLHKQYEPKTVKRKIASAKAFFSYLEYEEILVENPFLKIKIKFKEPSVLPRIIALQDIQSILVAAYRAGQDLELTPCQYCAVLRDIAVLELLFATGIRVSELCALTQGNVNLSEGMIRVYGKGAKERMIQISNRDVLAALDRYYQAFEVDIEAGESFFINRRHAQLSEQSVRFMIRKYTQLAHVPLHITPHMFRHSFATLLLEEDVDIRYIQQLLGHSSITTTQIYTHVAARKQRDILSAKHPRNKIVV